MSRDPACVSEADVIQGPTYQDWQTNSFGTCLHEKGYYQLKRDSG